MIRLMVRRAGRDAGLRHQPASLKTPGVSDPIAVIRDYGAFATTVSVAVLPLPFRDYGLDAAVLLLARHSAEQCEPLSTKSIASVAAMGGTYRPFECASSCRRTATLQNGFQVARGVNFK